MGKIKLNPEQRATAANAIVQMLEEKKSVLEGDIKNCITSSLRLGAFPNSDYGKILIAARVKKVQGRYYLMGTGPDKPEDEKTWKKKPKVEKPVQSPKDGQSVTLEGETVVTVKGSGHDFRSKAVKVIIFLSVAILLIVINPLGFW